MRAAVSLLAVFLFTAPAFATSYLPPERHDVYSPNGSFVLDLNPETGTHNVYSIWDRSRPLWSFSASVWQAPFFLSNDGEVVVELEWRHVKVEHLAETIGVIFWNRNGKFRTYPLTQLCPDPPKTQDVGVGPIGDFWRTWYTGTEQDGDTVIIRTTHGVGYRFRMSDGEVIEQGDIGPISHPVNKRWIILSLFGAVVFGGVLAFVLTTRRRARTAPPSEPPPASEPEAG